MNASVYGIAGPTITPHKVCDIYDRLLRELAVSIVPSEITTALENNKLRLNLGRRTPEWPTPSSTEH